MGRSKTNAQRQLGKALDSYSEKIRALLNSSAGVSFKDEEHEEFQSRAAQDNNSYVLGRVHEHNVVMAGVTPVLDFRAGLLPARAVGEE